MTLHPQQGKLFLHVTRAARSKIRQLTFHFPEICYLTTSQWASSISSSFTSPSLNTALSHLARPEYVSHPSGHLYMDQTRTSLGQIDHPIHALIQNASYNWDSLVARQSKSLPEAVVEYKRRYNRNPPKGFDDW